MSKTPEQILAEQEAGTGDVPHEVREFSTEDIAEAEDYLSSNDANDDADRRTAEIEMNNDTIDTLVDESQEFSDETVDSDDHHRG